MTQRSFIRGRKLDGTYLVVSELDSELDTVTGLLWVNDEGVAFSKGPEADDKLGVSVGQDDAESSISSTSESEDSVGASGDCFCVGT